MDATSSQHRPQQQQDVEKLNQSEKKAQVRWTSSLGPQVSCLPSHFIFVLLAMLFRHYFELDDHDLDNGMAGGQQPYRNPMTITRG